MCPGVNQVIAVTVKHPEALRWGFQLIARTAADQSKQAGTFTSDEVVRVRCEAGNAPCNGGIEFVEHSNAPRTAAGVGYTFNVTWTPPATDVGNVILYAAGNAANGDGNLTGDRIYTTLATISPVRPCALTLKPVISAVQNAGSFAANIGPGALFSIFGSGFQTASQTISTSSADFVDNAFPRKLACMAVEIDGKRVPITYSFGGTDQRAGSREALAAAPVTAHVILNPDSGESGHWRPLHSHFTNSFSGTSSPSAAGSVATTVANSATPVADPAHRFPAVFSQSPATS